MKKVPAVKNDTFNEFLLYKTADGKVKVEIFLHNETVWLSQKAIAALFDCSVDNVSLHLKNIFESLELQEYSVVEEFSVTATDGKNYSTKHYNLDAIIAVGYRVSSKKATQFRMWATERLREYIIKGFTMDDERLKHPNNIFGKDYFEEQLARIRDIRSSERRFYQKITDIYAQCSSDYDKDDEVTKHFFATVQNKLHFAISGQTAAEIIHERVDSTKEHMGLSTWKFAPDGPIRKPDVSVAKNYLDEKELDGLNRIVSMYLDYAESQAQKAIPMNMKDWQEKLDAFLKFNDREILENLGTISAELAKDFAESEYEKYRLIQNRIHESDFDREMKKFLENNDRV
jgi:hypothetical protein